MADLRFRKHERLLKRAEFDLVFAQRRSRGDAWLVVYQAENGRDHSRLGLVVGKRIGNAVVRARIKRLLREAFRHTKTERPTGRDLVVIPGRALAARQAPLTLGQAIASLVSLARDPLPSERQQRDKSKGARPTGSRRQGSGS